MLLSLASTQNVLLFQLYKISGYYGNLQFPLTYNGKSEKLSFIAVLLRVHFNKDFTEMFLEYGVVLYQPWEFSPKD